MREDRTDLRLIPPALAAWGGAALALGATGRASAAGIAGCCLAAALLLLVSRRRSHRSPARAPALRPASLPGPAPAGRPVPRLLLAAVLTLLCAAAGAAVAALHAADLHRGPLPGLAADSAHASVELTVTGDPHRSRPRVEGAQRVPGVIVIAARADRVATGPGAATEVRTPVLLLVRPGPDASHSTAASPPTDWLRLLPSTRLRVEAARIAAPISDGSGTQDIAAVLRLSGEAPPTVIGKPNSLQRLAGRLRSGLREATDGLARDARALLPGLVVGDTSRIPRALDEAFRATDMLHLLAVSGSNLTILLLLLIGPPGTASLAERRGLAPLLGIPLRATAVLGALITLGFVLVCRPEPSVLRAAACGMITILAIGTGRRRSLLPALAAAALVLVLYDPWLARDFGFLLSVLATASLLTVAPLWASALRRRGVPGRLAEALAAAAAAQAACAPVVAVLAAHVSLVAIPCNLLAEFAVAPATVLGFAALATAPFAIPLAEGLSWLAGWPTRGIAMLARTGAGLPGAEIGWPGSWTGALLLAVLVVALVLFARRLARHPWLCAACALLLALALIRPAPLSRTLTGWPPADWSLVACDVGQGDALVLAAGEGAGVLIDAGPDPKAVDECLRRLGVEIIPLLLLTHFHADHVAGLPGALRGRSVGAIQTTGLQEPADQAEFVHRIAREAGVPEIRAAPGERRRIGGLSWQVLWPDGSIPDPGSGSGEEGDGEANNASVTLLARTGDLTLFLPGDLEPPAQRRLLAIHPALPQVDVLKVAHHGSAYQEPALLERLSPRIALVSAGKDNPYGHPSPRTLAALRSHGTTVLRTDTQGALAVTPAGIITQRRGRRRRPARGQGPRPVTRARSPAPGGPGAGCRSYAAQAPRSSQTPHSPVVPGSSPLTHHLARQVWPSQVTVSSPL